MIDVNSHENFELQNPHQKPLEDLKIRINDGPVTRTISALDQHWIEKKLFLNYEAPNIVGADGKYIVGAKERWLELVNFILDDLTWLLRLPLHKFWSNIIYNSSIVDSLVSFLQEAPTSYTLQSFPDDYDLKVLFDKVRQNVLIVFARLVTNKENAFEHIGSNEHASLLYNKYIFTVPILMDLCQQYGRDNRKTVEKIVNTVFMLQPLYNEDLEKAATFVTQALNNIERRFEDCPVSQDGKAVPLSERGGANVDITLSDLEDMILYLIDTVSTISIFVDIFHPAVYTFREESFLTRIISMYSNAIPEMYKRLDNLAFKNEVIEKYLELKNFLDVIRVEILNIYRKVIYFNIQEVAKNKKIVSSTEMGEIIEDFLTNLMLTLSEKEFVIDYYSLYPFLDDFQVLSNIYPDLDAVKCDFIINSIFTFLDESAPFASLNSITKDVETVTNYKNTPSNYKLVESIEEVALAGPSNSNMKSEMEIMVLILEVKDVLCDLGEGFIERCLKHYNYNAESVINAVLEDSLPTELKSLDRSLPIIPPDPEEASASVDAAIGVQRLNIYDNDEFDIMTRDSVDTSKIHRGKRKDKYKSFNELLNDKSHLDRTKDIYNKYSIVSNEYDDEYDDTYDEHDIGSNAQDDIVEMDARPFTIPRVLRKQEPNGLDDIEENNDFDDAMNDKSNKDNFVQDPALLRAKAEERRLSKHGVRVFHPQSKSVVGNPKGQGQTKEVVDSRNNKNKQKASRANHNRRSGSQWKRNQGMVPS